MKVVTFPTYILVIQNVSCAHIKDHILDSMCSRDGVVRIVFATIALHLEW